MKELYHCFQCNHWFWRGWYGTTNGHKDEHLNEKQASDDPELRKEELKLEMEYRKTIC